MCREGTDRGSSRRLVQMTDLHRHRETPHDCSSQPGGQGCPPRDRVHIGCTAAARLILALAVCLIFQIDSVRVSAQAAPASGAPARQSGVAAAPRTPAGLPDRLTDEEFWGLIARFSEPNGYFDSDNLVSNEDTFQAVI